MKPTPKILSIVSFGILLLVISFIVSYTSFKNHSEILAQMGLIFELYALILYLMNRFKKSKNG